MHSFRRSARREALSPRRFFVFRDFRVLSRISRAMLALFVLFALHAPTARADTVTTTVSAGTNPYAVAVNPVTNKIYVANAVSNNVTVIDGATNAATPVSAGSRPVAVAVNPVTNKIYVANCGSACAVSGSGNGDVTVIDGATNMTTTVSAGSAPIAVAVNPVTNKIYVANGVSNNVTVIDGATNATTPVSAGSNPDAVAVNPVTNKIYVANNSSANVTVITEQIVNPIPLLVTISTLPNRRSFSSTPTFTFTPNSYYSPYSPNPQQVYYQLETWQGAWLKATPVGNGTDWTATMTPLQRGVHILYSWTGDGSEATSINPNRPRSTSRPSSSPITGQIAAYLFVVGPVQTYYFPHIFNQGSFP